MPMKNPRGAMAVRLTPNAILKPFSRTLDITVFSGHVHSTEAYLKDGIRYFVLGGGGADQAYTGNCDPAPHLAD